MSGSGKPVKVLFYTFTPRAFRSTLIGHLYEICQKYLTVLLSEKLDSDTANLLHDKKLFSYLEKVIPVRQFTAKDNIFSQNWRLFQQAREVIKTYRPDIVISGSDYNSLFELYLFRCAKKAGASALAIQPSLGLGETKVIQRWVDLTNIHTRFPAFVPIFLRKLVIYSRKHFGHFLIYWLMPTLAGQKPFLGKSSYVLREGNSGMRDTDFQIVLSEKECELFASSGVPRKKLLVLPHPFSRKSGLIFERLYESGSWVKKSYARIASIMLPNEISLGFHKKTWDLIERGEMEERWLEIVGIASAALPGWHIYIKPHPDGVNLANLAERFRAISKNIEVVNPRDPAEAYTKIADVVIGLPPPASTTLFTALTQSPEKPVLAIDFDNEAIGDYYKDFNGVEYITNKQEFMSVLESIRNKKFKKAVIDKSKSSKEFSSLIEIIEHVSHVKNL